MEGTQVPVSSIHVRDDVEWFIFYWRVVVVVGFAASATVVGQSRAAPQRGQRCAPASSLWWRPGGEGAAAAAGRVAASLRAAE